jgi:hypothetical protein
VDAAPDIKPRPNRERYIETLRAMTPEQRLMKALELSEMSRSLMRHGLRERHPEASEGELHALYLERLEQCRRRNC